MASKKDMRRDDLIISFIEPAKDKNASSTSATLAQSMPMAAMFMRNKMIGWTAVVFSIQNWLAESSDQATDGGNPAYVSVGLSFLSLAISYLPLFLPPPPSKTATPTGVQAPTPPIGR